MDCPNREYFDYWLNAECPVRSAQRRPDLVV